MISVLLFFGVLDLDVKKLTGSTGIVALGNFGVDQHTLSFMSEYTYMYYIIPLLLPTFCKVQQHA